MPAAVKTGGSPKETDQMQQPGQRAICRFQAIIRGWLSRKRKYRRAWYSAEQYERRGGGGYYIWRNEDGHEVMCTEITAPNATPMWKDAIDNGLVVAWVRSINILRQR